ncbi:host nuclease inhibitor GamL [Cedecea colo]|uniref:Host nuclease inhibitor GamL n=1 Tax=Cedecea colo TaxID=2552946 RepID=A0ABX0VJV6_9ENTR|nr:host nuclease inhibitor GamL [Cedecea colo]NIY47314.1 host nuclease inhibitor GamL [Cedecea colo]
MNAYANFDRAEDQKEVQHELQVFREEWIRNKADQLATIFPQCAMEFYPTHSRFSPYQVGLDSDEAQDAYAEYVDQVCLAKAKKLFIEAQFMGDVA